MKKVLALLTVALMLATVIVGCGDTSSSQPVDASGSQSTGASGSEPSEPVEVEVVRVWSDNAHEKELRLQQVDNFNNTVGKEKGIEIEYTVHGTNWQDTITIAAQAGEAPHLFRPNGAFLNQFVDSGYLIPITELPGGDEVVAQYEGSLVVNQHIFGGEVYTLPYNLTTQKFIINQDLFTKNGIESYPKTWEEVREYAKIITDNGGGKEYGYVLGMQSTWTANSYFLRLTAAFTGHVGFNNDTLQYAVSDCLPAVEAVMGMVADGSVLPGSAGLDADAMRAQFAAGNVGMIPGASFDTGVYNDQFPAECDWKVVPVPALTDDGSPYKEFVDATSLLGVGEASRDLPEKALEVFKFFYSDECMAEMYENGLYIPFRQEAMDMATKVPEQKGFAEFADVPDKVLMLPMPDGKITVEGDPYRETILALFAGTKGNDAKAVLEDLDNRYNTALEALDPAVLEEYKTPAGRDINKAG